MRAGQRAARLLPWLLLLYTCASLVHFTHNAEHLSAYPNLPPDWSRGEVYLAFALVCVPGLLGWLLYRGGAARAGITLLYIYAGLGFGALLHYLRAPYHRHTVPMNLTILAEAAAALALLVNLVFLARGFAVSAPQEWWFPAKRYGWGWGPPVTWQGWAVLLFWFAVFFAGMDFLRRHGILFPWLLGWVLFMSLLLLGLCYWKGEPPRWRWGDRRP